MSKEYLDRWNKPLRWGALGEKGDAGNAREARDPSTERATVETARPLHG